MYQVYSGATPNVFKITLLLEELGAQYRTCPVAVHEGEQRSPAFRSLNPNSKIPVLVDHEPIDGGDPIPVFESGAILIYLAEKHGLYLPAEPRARRAVLQWLMWQIGGLGPMAGQVHHFVHYSDQADTYAAARYLHETRRLYSVLDDVLETRTFVADEYSIADMAIWPWVYFHDLHVIALENYPNVRRYFAEIADRPAAIRAMNGLVVRPSPVADEKMRRALFGVLPSDVAR